MKSELQHRDRYEVAYKIPSTRNKKRVLVLFIVMVIVIWIIIFGIIDVLFPIETL